jgi:hypothetical protein
MSSICPVRRALPEAAAPDRFPSTKLTAFFKETLK